MKKGRAKTGVLRSLIKPLLPDPRGLVGRLHSRAGFSSDGAGGFFLSFFLGFALFLGLHLGFSDDVGEVFLHAFDSGERLVAKINAARDEVGGKGLHGKLAARDGHGAESADSETTEEEKAVFVVLVHFLPLHESFNRMT